MNREQSITQQMEQIQQPIVQYSLHHYHINKYYFKYLAVDLADNKSPIYAQCYIIDTIPTATQTQSGGLYNSTQNITITMSEPGTIYYTTNGTILRQVAQNILLPYYNSNTNLKFFAIDLAGNIHQFILKFILLTPFRPQLKYT